MEKNRFFPEMNGNFGFGCMRLPMNGDEVDYEEFNRMIDAFISAGFNYFDTAHGYISGKSEIAIGECLAKRYDRSAYLLTNKLSDGFFKTQADIRPLFELQLEKCGVDYFDFYLMHAQDHNNYPRYNERKAYETALAFKEEGLIRHLGISFHDKAVLLDRILTDHPEIEVVQIQFNYLDYEDSSVEARKVYEVCEKHAKPVIVMEPVKGGSLVNLPAEADSVLRNAGKGSNASYAMRFAASFPQMAMVISGMSNLPQMLDNIETMQDFRPLEEKELQAINRVRGVFSELNLVPCTACKYCIEQNQCPAGILIPDLFAAINSFESFHNWNTKYYYSTVLTGSAHGKASDCLQCGMCEGVCPQHLEIRSLLEKVAGVFEQ